MKLLRKCAALAIAGVAVGTTMAVAPSPAHAATFASIGRANLHGRVITLWRKTSGGVGLHGHIAKASEGDLVYLENWPLGQIIGYFRVQPGTFEANTHSIGTSGSTFRACAKVGNDARCTEWGTA